MTHSLLQKSLLVGLLLMASNTAFAHSPTEDTPSSLPPVLQNTSNVRLDPSPVAGLQQVTAGRNVFYMSPDGAYLVIGRILRASDGADLTADAEHRVLRPFFRQLVEAAPIRWGSGERELLVFLDPDCPFCRKLWPVLRQLTGVHIAVHLMGGPVSLGPILCHANPIEALDRYFTTGPQAGPLCNKIDAARYWTQLAHVDGTPTFLNDQLDWRHGLLTLEDLQAWVTEQPAATSSKEGVTP